jgi:Fe-S oxidoreductase
MATWKAEFLAHHYAGRLHPLQHYAFGFMDKWASTAALAPWMANLPLRIAGVSRFAKSILDVAEQRQLPAFARLSFRSQFLSTNGRTMKDTGKQILLWPDTWNNYFHPSALTAAAKVLADAGHSVQIPPKHICCGRPLYDFGFLDAARNYLVRILDAFEPQILAGIPVVMLEPSCASVFQDELVNFFPKDDRAIKLSRQTVMLSEVMVRSGPEWRPPQLNARRIVVHGHCHQKALMTMNDEMSLLQATGAEVEMLDSGCCGMAGPFGFEKDKFAVSQTLAERVLLPAIRAAADNTILVSNGFSCREQIKQNTSRKAVHLAEVLAGNC